MRDSGAYTCSTYIRHIVDIYSTYDPHVFDTYSTYIRHILDIGEDGGGGDIGVGGWVKSGCPHDHSPLCNLYEST